MVHILITGITGFIGAHLASYLSNQSDNKIYGICRSAKYESTFNALNLNNNKNIVLIKGNINIYSDIEEILCQYDIDNIYHLAAKVIVKDSAKSPRTTYITNILGTINILEALRLVSMQQNKEIPTLVMSTDKAYGESKILPYTEQHPLNGIEIYPSSKACEDIIARAYAHNYNLPVTVSRPCNVYGLDFNWSRIVPSLALACLHPINKNKPLILNEGSYHHVREFIYVKDIVKALTLLLKNIDKTKKEAYNISSNSKYTTQELVQTFLELSDNKNKEIIFKEKEKTFKEIESQYLDIKKLLVVIPEWKAEYNLYTGLKQTIEEYKNWFKK